MDVQLEVSGMTCASCARHVQAALEAGAQDVHVDWRHGRAWLRADRLGQETLQAALAPTRYRVEQVRPLPSEPEGDGHGPQRDYDLVVVGSGGGAFAGAIRARDLGRRVLLVERATIGGTCVNVGCIPSKTLLAAARRAGGQPAALAAAAADRKAALVARLRQEKYVDLLNTYGIQVRCGQARLVDPHTVLVDGQPVTAEAILLAVGARPAVPPIPGLEQAGYLTSTSALEQASPPGRLAVLGAGPVGLELGQMFGLFGSQVSFIARRRLAPAVEPELSAAMRQVLQQAGHRVLEQATTSVTVEGGEKVLRGRLGDGRPLEVRADELLVATGRHPNTEGLGLAEVGVATDGRGAIVVDAEQRTSVASVFAAGDATTQPQYVYVAAAGGAAAHNALAGGHERLDFEALPRIVFTFPQLATAGLTQAQARARGLAVDVAVLPLTAVPRALVNGDTSGLVKLVAEAGTGRLVGPSMLAEAAGEVIHAAVLAISQHLTVQQLAATWAPYLTMAEGLRLAAQTFDRDVARLSCCAA